MTSHAANQQPLAPNGGPSSGMQAPPEQPQPDTQPDMQSSHMLKTGRRGNPFCKDTHDLFATLMVSLELKNNSRFFKTYPNSFTTDDAAANLASLRFSQSNRTTDPNDASRIVTTTTTTTFTMSREIAKGMCQHFMDARLIQNAVDAELSAFKERGIYQITPKGLHILERFITKNGISADGLVHVFTSQPICMKLLHLERRQSDDEIHVSRVIVEAVFRRFSGGRHPNYMIDQLDPSRPPNSTKSWTETTKQQQELFDRSGGVEFQDLTEKFTSGDRVVVKHVFNSVDAVEWLGDFTTVCCREEAADLLAHFVRYGYISLFSDKSKSTDRVMLTEVLANPGTANHQRAQFKWGVKVFYRVTDEGKAVAAGSVTTLAAARPAMPRDPSHEKAPEQPLRGALPLNTDKANDKAVYGNTALTEALDSQLISGNLIDLFRGDASEPVTNWAKEPHSSTARLTAILEQPALRALFRDYLRSSYCEENLGFWLDVADFRRRFSTTSSAIGGRPGVKAEKSTSNVTASSAMEVHQQALVSAAMNIYDTYLAPASPSELNIDHNLRGDVVTFVQKIQQDSGAPKRHSDATDATADGNNATSDLPGVALRASQVQTLLRHYERIQGHIFRLLATDQVPKFIRTPKFLEILAASDAQRGGSQVA
ncbi:uncharacterized protein L969DRAFT_94380 [Mixia osmundae IAM 14324]|uniref:RGS domain-containing protein n=1 Tax=Mixia osmundae (strain CBS 9802 / IAM 14324 / JCM 22182 / KY 12970) TaxID=764103 RepID=G7E3B0_MIXOS|nr:uncharacterized protein L969DRAFT_94380 [Mixia osmundae IAM 14324]KEI39307.1 hypothetical protein L969DRAFT_94380 [Mixia osmundae IAM 14324]GAA97320.1 hypothetical protein E5Q_03998 [Mixia osmundae IAM 14324]